MARPLFILSASLLTATLYLACGGEPHGASGDASPTDAASEAAAPPGQDAAVSTDAATDTVATETDSSDPYLPACLDACPKASDVTCRQLCEGACRSGRCTLLPEKPFPWQDVVSVTCTVASQTVDFFADGKLRGCSIN
jgi:hypothetical protein